MQYVIRAKRESRRNVKLRGWSERSMDAFRVFRRGLSSAARDGTDQPRGILFGTDFSGDGKERGNRVIVGKKK